MKKLLELYLSFTKIGFFTFGGGMAMLPLLREEMVKQGLSQEEIDNFFSLGQALPGVIAINSATLVGRKLNGIKGAIAATMGVLTPCYVVIIAFILIFQKYLNSSLLQAIFFGIRSIVAALIIFSGYSILARNLKKSLADKIFFLALFLLTIFLLYLKINPLYLILGALALSFFSFIFLIKRKA